MMMREPTLFLYVADDDGSSRPILHPFFIISAVYIISAVEAKPYDIMDSAVI